MCSFLSLSRRVDVFGLGHAGQLVLVAGQAAEEDRTADAEESGAPAEAVRPGVEVVSLEDELVEFNRVDDQSDDLENNCREVEKGERFLGVINNHSGQKTLWLVSQRVARVMLTALCEKLLYMNM